MEKLTTKRYGKHITVINAARVAHDIRDIYKYIRLSLGLVRHLFE